MAKIPDKNVAVYPKEREVFLRDLHHFHETRGTSFRRTPVIGGKEVDLYQLYTLVTSQGGWIKVNSKGGWTEVLEELDIPKDCVNASVALKQIYLRYLDRWEKVHFLGEEADRGSDDDEESRHKRWSARSLHSVPHTYNYNQHIIAESNREYNHLSTQLYKASDYDKLALSLISPLPNEQDFAINVCTLLSNDGKHTLKLEKHPRIIDYLLGHAGVYSHSSLRKLFVHCYSTIRKHPIHNFWNDVLESREFFDLTDETRFLPPPPPPPPPAITTTTSAAATISTRENGDNDVEDKKNLCLINDEANLLLNGLKIESNNSSTDVTIDNSHNIRVKKLVLDDSDDDLVDDDDDDDDDLGKKSVLITKNDRMEVDSCDLISDDDNDSDCEILNFAKKRFKFKLRVNRCDRELFSLNRGLGTQEYIGQRVLQITTILRNLSFIEENVPVLLKNKTFLRFLLLCSVSRWGHLRNLGLDMLGNIATEFLVKDYPHDRLSEILLTIVVRGLRSEDRAACISSLEVLNKLSQNEFNEEVLVRFLEVDIYEKVCSFLTIHDVMLLIYTLECLYSLSSLGERSCNLIVSNHGVVDTLVSLVTVEGKSYGPKACIGMKLVETLPGGISNNNNNNTSNTAGSTTISAQSTPATSSNVAVTASSAATLTPAKITVQTTPVRTVQIAPQRLITVSPSNSTSGTTRVIFSSSQSIVATNNTSVVATSTTATTQSTTMTPQQLIQQQHAHQQAIHENEQFALAWLRATYEPCVNGKIDHQELYKHYMNSCSKIGRRGVISPLHFPRCVRSVFGGTVGPNPMKPSTANEPQYYEGIKVRAQPLIINIQTASNPNTQTTSTIVTATSATTSGNNNSSNKRNKQQSFVVVTSSSTTTPTSPSLQLPSTATITSNVLADNNNTSSNSSNSDNNLPVSPASPILKAQLSAPPKQRDTATPNSKGDIKSQVMAHPHLSQALLGSGSANNSTLAAGTSKENQTLTTIGQSNTSLIKSLLATKVNDCMTTVSMRTATDCQNVAQVAARQQRLLAQQISATTTPSTPIDTKNNNIKNETPKTTNRLNGARQLFNENDVGDSSVSSTTQFSNLLKGKKEPPQPPPPPLAPLSSSNNNNKKMTATTTVVNRIDNEDSDSTGNNSLASSSGMGTIGIGGISSTEDGENSLTSFEGLLNGIPNIDNPLNEDSNSKDSVKLMTTHNEIMKNKPLRLADLLEKKIEKTPPILNGGLGKELRLGGDLVENHIEKALSRENNEQQMQQQQQQQLLENNGDAKKMDESHNKQGVKRAASDDISEIESKKVNINGNNADSPAPPDSVSSSNGGGGGGSEENQTVSTAAAKLFADMAADILEGEDEEQLLESSTTTTTQQSQPQQTPVSEVQQQQQPSAISTPQITQAPATSGAATTTPQPVQQILVDGNNQQVLLTQPRQIIVQQQSAKTPVIVQNAGQQQQRQGVMLQQNAAGQILLSQGLQGQVQLVASPTQPGQYLLQTSGNQGTYMVAQPQTAVVHGQPQTVLVAQTAQQQGSGTKTIIILQQQPAGATHHPKVMVTPQGQQVVVTQVHRPVLQASTVTNNILPAATSVIKTATVTAVVTQQSTTSATTTTTNGVVVAAEKKVEDTKPKIVRDLTTPFVCEWGDCNVETKFKSANQVYMHVCEAHCPKGSEEIVCQWERCDNMKRKKFSLMTHLHDKHCNTEVMKQSLARRKQMSQGGKVEPPPPTPTTHPGYAPDAALHAIKRHALEFVNPKELQDDNEGPVTKSIRLTASLILRNLVIYSSNCRRYLKHYEPHLANVALSNVESSRTIAQVLYDMNEGSSHR